MHVDVGILSNTKTKSPTRIFPVSRASYDRWSQFSKIIILSITLDLFFLLLFCFSLLYL